MIDAVQKRISNATEKDWNGEKVYLRKLGADQVLAFLRTVTAEKDKSRTPEEERDQTADLHARNVSKSYADKDGNLTYDSDEGIATLKKLPFDELVSLGDLVLAHTGYGSDEKKSTQPANSSPSSSAETSETSTAPTPTTSLAG